MIQNNTTQICSMGRNDNFYQIVHIKFEKRRYHNNCYCADTSREKTARYLKKRKFNDQCIVCHT